MNAATKPEPTTSREGKVTTYTNVQARSYKRRGVTYPGEVRTGHHVEVKPGEYVRLYGTMPDRCRRLTLHNPDGTTRVRIVHVDVPYDITFRIGDEAEYDSYNLKYTGPILAIGQRTVTIKGMTSRKRLTMHEFSWRNEDFDAEKIAANNAETMMHI